MSEAILVLNAGSSSLKFGLFSHLHDEEEPRPLLAGSIHDPGGQRAHFRVTAPNGKTVADEPWAGVGAPIEQLIDWIEGRFPETQLTAIGHRVVHGGMEFSDPVEMDDEIIGRLELLSPLAPLHQPTSLEPVRRIASIRPRLRQFACFDTAFHHTIGPPASRYALPREFEAEGIRRYGFHGLSYESIAAQLRKSDDARALRPDSRIIVAHLGSGASLCAMLGLKSVETTMGFSTLDGLVMGTRPGLLDPGILLYLLQEKKFTAARLEQLLYCQSGLLGVSGISSDVSVLLKSDDPAAAEALDLFAFQVARQTAGLASSLGGVDRIIFTGGIGEHAPSVRRAIVERLKWLEAGLDERANEAGSTVISTEGSSILLERRTTQEELMIARHVLARLDHC